MNTWVPVQAAAARLRAAKPAGGGAVVTHFGVHWPVLQLRPGPQSLLQPPQFLASPLGSMQVVPHRICGGMQLGKTQTLALHTLPPVQSPSPQHSKHPCCAQQRPPPAHAVENAHVPPALQLSVVQRSPSLQSAAPQHCRQLAPQSLGVLAAHAHTELLQIAPGLQALGQLPQCAGSLRVSTSQPSGVWLLQLAKPGTQLGTPATHC